MAKKKQLTIQEIMDAIIDKDLLEERKKNSKRHVIPKEETNHDKPKEKMWWEIPMKKDNFIIKRIEGIYYVRYSEWKKYVWIGPYESRKKANDIVKMYVNETKKDVYNRNIEDIHSVILPIE